MDHWRSPARNQDRQIRRTVGGHMQRHVFLLAMIIGAAPLAAQEPQCNNIPFPGATAACNTAVDVLRSALVLPTGIKNLTVDSNATHISDAALGIGYGVRVGVLNGGFPIPAVSVSYMHRTVPRLRYGTLGPAPGTGDQFEFTM